MTAGPDSPLPGPREALFDDGDAAPVLPVCDHYSGVEVRMRKSLELQAELGPVFDVTLDGEDGAPVGGELEHAQLMVELVNSTGNRFGRVGIRLQPVDHPAFERVLATVVHGAGARVAYLMIPKPRGLADLQRAVDAVDAESRRAGLARLIPLQALIETHGALREVQALAAHPRIESLSFGVMDFVSAHRGAIPASAMGVKGQFEHPLVLRAKLEIAAACHAFAKVPSHSVVPELKDSAALAEAARKASRELGYTPPPLDRQTRVLL
ncbi:MAG TPA: aldolase/citrate lyase family protein, partial [Rubrivivax sp.]|nr:aldolase/citrate lyase family protein [Rubrivivax sp.]